MNLTRVKPRFDWRHRRIYHSLSRRARLLLTVMSLLQGTWGACWGFHPGECRSSGCGANPLHTWVHPSMLGNGSAHCNSLPQKLQRERTCVAHNTVRAAVVNTKRQQCFQLATSWPSGVIIPASWSPPWVVTYPQLEGTLQRHYLPQKQHEGEISVELTCRSTNDQKIALAGLCLTRKH